MLHMTSVEGAKVFSSKRVHSHRWPLSAGFWPSVGPGLSVKGLNSSPWGVWASSQQGA